jgi:hypothetical protein
VMRKVLLMSSVSLDGPFAHGAVLLRYARG